MDRDNHDKCNRRTVLKTLSGAAIGMASVGTASSSSEPDIPSTDAVICSNNSGNRFGPDCGGGGGGPTWDTVSSDYMDSESLLSVGTVNIAMQVQHFMSEYVNATGEWFHHMSLSSVASKINSGPNTSSVNVDPEYYNGFEGQKFKVQGPPGNDLYASYPTAPDKNGVYPNGGSDFVGDTALPFMKSTISEVIPGTGFLFTLDDVLNDSNTLPDNTVDSSLNSGYKYRNEAGYIEKWDWCSHFHKMHLWDSAEMCAPVNVDVGFLQKRKLFGNEWKNFELDFAPDANSWDGFNPFSRQEADRNDVSRTLNPENMTQNQIDNLGVKQYTGNRTVRINGDRYTPKYVMFNNPFTAIERQ